MGNVRAELRAAGLLSSTTISHISTENLFRERRRICLREITFYDAFDTIPLVLVHEIVKGCDSYLANHKSVQPEKRNGKQGPLTFFVPKSNGITLCRQKYNLFFSSSNFEDVWREVLVSLS